MNQITQLTETDQYKATRRQYDPSSSPNNPKQGERLQLHNLKYNRRVSDRDKTMM